MTTPPARQDEPEVAPERPPFSRIVRMMYWSARRDYTTIPHLVAVFFGSLVKYIVLRQRLRFPGGRPTVAIAMTERMGDIIAGEPISRLARRRFPSARIYWVALSPYRELASSFPAIDGAIVVRCLTEWLLLWSYGLTDIVWDLHLSERGCAKCRVVFRKAGLAGQRPFAIPYYRDSLLAVECMSAGLAPMRDGPILTPGTSAIQTIDGLALPTRFMVIHCEPSGVGEFRRDWSNEKWAALVEHIIRTFDISVIEIGTRPRVITRDGHLMKNLCGKLSIMESAELIRRARLFIGVDSGPAHMANAAGTEGIILLAHYPDFRRHSPFTGYYQTERGATLMWADESMENISLDAVIRETDRRLGRAERDAAPELR